MKKLLEVKDLKINIEVDEGTLHAVRGIDFEVCEGEALGIVGESGSGKSISMRAIMGLLPENASFSGQIFFDGQDLSAIKEKGWELIRGNQIAIVNQNVSNNLNPIIKVGKQMSDAILARKKNKKKIVKKHLKTLQKLINFELFKHSDEEIYNYINGLEKSEKEKKYLCQVIKGSRFIYFEDISKKAIYKTCIDLLKDVGIDNPEGRLEQYPFELSGGMRQRIVIAIALSGNPSLVIFDEPTTALDVTIQAQILTLIKKLQQEKGFALIFISHNLAVVSKIVKRVMVMYAGKILESGNIEQVFHNPFHPYTKALIRAIPSIDGDKKLYSIPGGAPDLINVEDIDQFAYRNQTPLEIDFMKEPPLFKIEEGHFARTWLAHKNAPKLSDELNDEKSDIKRVYSDDVVLQVKHISKTFINKIGSSLACRDINVNLHKGEILCLVGESGSGKTTLGRIIAGQVRQDKGTIELCGHKLSEVNDKDKYFFDHSNITDVQMIFQDSSEALNPRLTIYECIAEGLELSKKYSKDEINKKVRELLKQVDLDETLLSRYPHMISGGQRQRVQIARALAVQPKVLIADEPVSDLDVSIQANIIHLFDHLRKENDLSIILITHDLSIAKYIADRIMVLYCGRVVEYGKNSDVFSNPLHQYTINLLKSIPSIDLKQDFSNIERISQKEIEEGTYIEKENGHIFFSK